MLLRLHNLNLLPILRELLRTRSVSKTAISIGLSQSAVSAALARLRETFEDDLLVMQGRKLVPTELAERLHPQVESACGEIEALLQPGEFSPLVEQRRFVVETADYVALLLAPELGRLLGEKAPHASVQFVDIGSNLQARLLSGEMDILAIPLASAGRMRDRFSWAPLFSDELVVIASQANKGFEGDLTRKAYEAAPHAMFQLAPRHSVSNEVQSLERAGIRHRDRVLVESFLTLPAIVEASDCLALVQRRLAEKFQRSHGIEIHVPPFVIEPVTIAAFWSKSVDREAPHAWFRDLLIQAAQPLQSKSTLQL